MYLSATAGCEDRPTAANVEVPPPGMEFGPLGPGRFATRGDATRNLLCHWHVRREMGPRCGPISRSGTGSTRRICRLLLSGESGMPVAGRPPETCAPGAQMASRGALARPPQRAQPGASCRRRCSPVSDLLASWTLPPWRALANAGTRVSDSGLPREHYARTSPCPGPVHAQTAPAEAGAPVHCLQTSAISNTSVQDHGSCGTRRRLWRMMHA